MAHASCKGICFRVASAPAAFTLNDQLSYLMVILLPFKNFTIGSLVSVKPTTHPREPFTKLFCKSKFLSRMTCELTLSTSSSLAGQSLFKILYGPSPASIALNLKLSCSMLSSSLLLISSVSSLCVQSFVGSISASVNIVDLLFSRSCLVFSEHLFVKHLNSFDDPIEYSELNDSYLPKRISSSKSMKTVSLCRLILVSSIVDWTDELQLLAWKQNFFLGLPYRDTGGNCKKSPDNMS